MPAPQTGVAKAPEVIREIQLLGLDRVNRGEVEAQLTIHIGDPFDPAKLDEEYQRIYDTGQYQWIDAPMIERIPGGVRVIIRFHEKRQVADIRFDGMESLTRSEQLGQLRTKARQLLDSTDLNLDRLNLIRQYKEKGFLFAEVKTEIGVQEIDQASFSGTLERFRELDVNGDGVLDARESAGLGARVGAVVIFKVSEGPQVSVERLDFEGNDSYSDSELAATLTTKVRSWFFGFPNGGSFNEEQFFQDLHVLEIFYRSAGFFDVNIHARDFAFNRARDRLYIGIRIEEGKRYRVSDVRLEVVGKGVFPQNVLEDQINIDAGEFYDQEVIVDDLESIRKLYMDRAYIEARTEVVPIVSETGNEVDIVYRIEEGQKFYIEDVVIRGNTETREKVIRRELTFYPGEAFSYSKIADSVSNLYYLRYFDNVEPYHEPGSTTNQKKLVVDVKEGTTGRLIFGFGVASSRGFIGNIALSKRNFDILDLPESISDIPDAFTGGGQELLLEAAPGSEYSKYRAMFSEPHIFDTNTSLKIEAYKVDFLREQYRDDRLGTRLTLGHRFTNDLSAALSYSFEKVHIRDIDDDAAPDVFRVQGTTRISRAGMNAAYDRRTFRPVIGAVDGWVVEGEYDYSGGPLGADLDISQAGAHFKLYRTVFQSSDVERYIITFRNSVRWAEEHHNNHEVPIFERERLGGNRTLRGFRWFGVGPQFHKDPLGGTMLHYGSLQFGYPIYKEILRGVVFLDYGNLSSTPDQYRLREYRMSTGLGVLLNLSFFGQPLPIALSWGEPLLKEDTDREKNFLFDIGIGF